MRTFTTLVCCSLLALASGGLAAQEAAAAAPPVLTFDQLFSEAQPGAWPKQLGWSPDGSRLAYLLPAAEGDGEVLWAQPAAGGEAQRLLATSELVAAGVEDGELAAYQWTPDGGALLLEAGGDLFLRPLPDGPLRRLTETGAEEEDPKLSADGRLLSFVRDNDLYVFEVASRSERRLTRDGEENRIWNGKTDWVYWEEIWGRDSTGHWWSPDGRRLAFYRFDDSAVGTYPLVDFTQRYPTVEPQRYPKAGTTNPRVQVGVIAAAGGEPVWLDTGDDPDVYLARVRWTPDGRRVAIQRLNRDQTRLDLLLCDPGSGGCETLLSEEWETWINLGDDFTFLADGSFLWGSERNGWRHLYLYGADGRLIRPVTGGRWSVTSLDHVDEEGGFLVFTAYGAAGMGAAYRYVYRVGLDGQGAAVLAGDRGWNQALVAPDGSHWLHSRSTGEEATRRVLRRLDGGKIKELPSGPEAGFDPAELPAWQLVTLWGLDGNKLPARLLEPVGRQPGERYPVIMYHYGGPGSQVVTDRCCPRRDLWHKMMAQRGYGVLSVDNSASAFFGKRGEDQQHRRFGEVNLSAQLSGVEYLKTLPWVDPERIGLWGWSGGGSNTLYCVLNRPGTWAAAVAGAPVTDWMLYDTIWTERYLDHPVDNAEGYEASSPVTYAGELADPLLVVHGTADDNVHPQNTLQLSQALVEAGVPFEMAIYPRQKHGLRGAAERHFYTKMTEFFDRHLGGGGQE